MRRRLLEIYRRLYRAFGPQHWWPGEGPFEVAVGAVLTQNTAWRNVERAIANLKREGVLSLQGLLALPEGRLAELIRPAGYFNVKARRLRNLLDHLARHGGDLEGYLAGDLEQRRRELLAVNGLGPETVDSILLYAGNRPTFVCDAYTRRLLTRHRLIHERPAYEEMRRLFMDHLPEDVALYNEYHALIVRTGYHHCKPRPRCEGCPLEPLLAGESRK
ncbi:MAG: endonuclease III domain-containing protein [Nitrospirae bacterium]|nr:MAG: endonuclease III domain-containing protein [Nitrospirota bacterium]